MMTRIFSIFAVMMLLSAPAQACDKSDGGKGDKVTTTDGTTAAPTTGTGE